MQEVVIDLKNAVEHWQYWRTIKNSNIPRGSAPRFYRQKCSFGMLDDRSTETVRPGWSHTNRFKPTSTCVKDLVRDGVLIPTTRDEYEKWAKIKKVEVMP